MRPLTVVTGGGRGIGAAICRRLAADGHDIAFSYLADEQRAHKTVEAITAHGARCVAVQGDVADRGRCRRAVRRRRRFGRGHGRSTTRASSARPGGWSTSTRPSSRASTTSTCSARCCARAGSRRHRPRRDRQRLLRRGHAWVGGRVRLVRGREGGGGDDHRRALEGARPGHPRQLRRAGHHLDRAPRRPAAAGQARRHRSRSAARASRTRSPAPSRGC